MSGWIKPLRFTSVLMGALLATVGFVVSGIKFELPFLTTILFVLAAGTATMVNNDWEDRFHDAKKGKVFALKNNRAFGKFNRVLWGFAILSVIAQFAVNINFGLLSVALLFVGLNYKAVYRYPLLPGLLVALMATGPLAFAQMVRASSEVWILIFGTFLLVFGREVIKDIYDMKIDGGYKWTLPLAVGEKSSRILVAALYFAAFLPAIRITPYVFIVTPLFIITAVFSLSGKSSKLTKTAGDISLVIGLLTILTNEILTRNVI